MILTGHAIEDAVKKNDILIDPFNIDQLNPNSYDFCLGDTLKVYTKFPLDAKKCNPTKTMTIPKAGLTLHPQTLYLGHTEERIGSNHYVPIIRGRSSTGRLGLFVHITADLIDIGAIGQWTLQMHVVQPLVVYPHMKIGQVTFWCVKGAIDLYQGKYQNACGPVASKSYKDF